MAQNLSRRTEQRNEHCRDTSTIYFQAGDRVVYRRRNAVVVGVAFFEGGLPVCYHIRLDNGILVRSCAKDELIAQFPPRQKCRENGIEIFAEVR